MNERISYPKELIEQIGAYLASKANVGLPFGEVYQLVSDLKSKGEPVAAEAKEEAD